MTAYPSFERVVAYHHELMLREGQQAVLMDASKLEAALARPLATAFGEDAFPALSAKAAALFQGIAIGHPFMDGNKRIALGAMLLLLEMNEVPLAADEDALYDLTIAVAAGEMREVEEIAARIAELFGIE